MTDGRGRIVAGPPAPHRGGRSRAQTTIDFMIGAGVFLLVVAFVLSTIPGMIDPFSDRQETTIVADRLATQIAEGMLAEPDRPTVLNASCTFVFFNDTLGEGEDCPVPFVDEELDLRTRLGVQERQSINVTIQRVDSGGDHVVQSTDGESLTPTGHTRLSIGPTVPTEQSVIAASRTAYLDGKDVTVVVYVW